MFNACSRLSLALAMSLFGACGTTPATFTALDFANGPNNAEQSEGWDVSSGLPQVVVGSSGYNEFPESGGTQHHQGDAAVWLLGIPKALAANAILHAGGQAVAISENGKLIIGYIYTVIGPNQELGFETCVWDEATGFAPERFPPLPGFVCARAYSYSDDRDLLAGYSQDSGAGQPVKIRGCVWTRQGAVIPLSENVPLVRPDSSRISAISNEGNTIVGSIFAGTGPATFKLPCVWERYPGCPATRTDDPSTADDDYDFTPMVLPLLPEMIEGSADDLSSSGRTLVGYCSNGGVYVACQWLRSPTLGTYTASAVPGVPAAGISGCSGVSGDGSTIIGITSDANFVSTAWICAQGGTVTPLFQAIEAHGATIQPGWTRTQANAISKDGCNFAGLGVDPGGLQRAWTATMKFP